MTSLSLGVLLFKVIEDISHAQTITADLIRIGRTNTLTSSSNLILTLLSLISSVEHAMRRHDQMSLLRDMQTRMEIVTTGLQCFGLFHKEVGSQHNTITDNVHLTTLEDTRGNRAQHILLAFKLQRMTSIRTTLETGNHIVLRGQHIDHLTFSFVAPLQSEQDIYFTFVHNSICSVLTVLVSLPSPAFSRVSSSSSGKSCKPHRHKG